MFNISTVPGYLLNRASTKSIEDYKVFQKKYSRSSTKATRAVNKIERAAMAFVTYN